MRHSIKIEKGILKLPFFNGLLLFHFNFINNGNLPTEPIIEGGGLSSIRQQVSNNHGMMNVITQPTFNLEIKLPLFERGQDD